MLRTVRAEPSLELLLGSNSPSEEAAPCLFGVGLLRAWAG